MILHAKQRQTHRHRKQTTTTTTAKSLQSCPTLCDPIDGSPPGSPVPGILRARTLEWVAISFCRDLPDSGIEPASLMSPTFEKGFFTTSTTWEAEVTY